MHFKNFTKSPSDLSPAESSLTYVFGESPVFTKIFENAFLEECTAVFEKIQHFDHLLVLGIGGSALGTQAVLQALGKSKKVTVLDTVEPDAVHQVLSSIDWETTCINVISKSGGTLETALQLSIVESILQKKFSPEEISKRIICTTETGSLLFDHAQENQYLTLPVPRSIGGRFSVFTPVGVLPLLFASVDVKLLLSSAQKAVHSPESKKLVCDLAASQFHAYRNEKRNITVLISYHKKLMGLLDWYRQLLAESLGKNENTGITPVLAFGSTDQHSQIQLYCEGPQDKLVIFLSAPFAQDKEVFKILGMKNPISLAETQKALLFGTKKNLESHNRPFIELSFDQVNEEEIGAFLMVQMLVIAVLGDMLKIDTYNQPGVEEGKIQSKRFLMQECK